MAELIRFATSNFTLTLLVMGVAAGLRCGSAQTGWRQVRKLSEALLAYFVLFTVAVAYFYNIVVHVFFSEAGREFHRLGGQPVQAEVG